MTSVLSAIQLSGITTNGPAIELPRALAKTELPREGVNLSGQTGDGSSGMGFARKSFLHWCAVHRAHRFDFLRRALSVEMPVPAYICL
jgi:hypothetical protein